MRNLQTNYFPLQILSKMIMAISDKYQPLLCKLHINTEVVRANREEKYYEENINKHVFPPYKIWLLKAFKILNNNSQ